MLLDLGLWRSGLFGSSFLASSDLGGLYLLSSISLSRARSIGLFPWSTMRSEWFLLFLTIRLALLLSRVRALPFFSSSKLDGPDLTSIVPGLLDLLQDVLSDLDLGSLHVSHPAEPPLVSQVQHLGQDSGMQSVEHVPEELPLRQPVQSFVFIIRDPALEPRILLDELVKGDLHAQVVVQRDVDLFNVPLVVWLHGFRRSGPLLSFFLTRHLSKTSSYTCGSGACTSGLLRLDGPDPYG